MSGCQSALLGRGGASCRKEIIDNPARLLLRYVPNSYVFAPRANGGYAGACNCSEVCPCRSNPPVECCRAAEQCGSTATSFQRRCADHGPTGPQRPGGADWSSEPRAKDVPSWSEENLGTRSL